MNHSPNYRKATNAAYQLLAQNSAFSIATNVFYFVEHYIKNAVLLTYGQACFLYGFTLELLMENSEFGFTIVSGTRRIILYNENCSIGCIRFTIAHEIGHAVLGHSKEHDQASEKEANCFARNFLCPIPLVHIMECQTVSDYIHAFNVTEKMACVSFDKRESDYYYIENNLYNIISDMLDAYMFDFEDVNEHARFLVS